MSGREEKKGAGVKGAGAKRAGSGSVAAKISASVGIVAAMVLALVVNLYVSRHYKRWDVTTGGLYTLSDPTLQTLRGLEETVEIYVLTPKGDPLTVSVGHLLSAYKAETARLTVKRIDPDRSPAELIAVQQRFGVVDGVTSEGRVLSEAAVIVARRDRPHFLTANDLVAVDDAEDMRVRPRLEEALTTAIRSVTTDARPKVCFATGHGEKPLDAGGSAGLAALKDRLHRNNYDTREIQPFRAGEKEDLPGCELLVIAGPNEAVPAEDVARYVGFVKGGGSLLVAVDPVINDRRDAVNVGLGELFAAIGLAPGNDFVFELDSKRKEPDGFGEIFLPLVSAHPITEGLLKVADRGVGVTMAVATSLSKAGGEASLTPLLVTSDKAFGMVDFAEWAKNPGKPSAKEGDHKGPLTVAWAAELPKGKGARGARAVALGSSSVLVSSNWQSEELRGTRALIESSISWLVARPALVEVPKKPSVTAGIRVSEEDVNRLALYVLLCMPLASALFGVAVFLRRRSGERRRAPSVRDAGEGRRVRKGGAKKKGDDEKDDEG